MRIRAVSAIVLTLALACVPALARASVWKEGTASTPFGIADYGGLLVTADSSGDQALTVPYEASTAFEGSSLEFEPRSFHVASDGSWLVACGKHGYVLRIYRNGSTRMYTSTEIAGLERPFDAFPLDGGMLIVDRGVAAGEGRVIQVDAADNVVWRYGGVSGLGAGQVWDPFTAEPLAGGHMLIADSLGQRVIEIDTGTGAIVWSYGTYKVAGASAGLLDRPHSAQKLDNGHVLICDSENQRVIEVDHDNKIVWQFGSGVMGSGPGELKSPNWARRLSGGVTMICDSANGRVIEVDGAGKLVRAFGMPGRTPAGGMLSDPRAATRMPDGSTLIADLGNMRLARYGFHPHKEFVATSGRIDPSVGTLKVFTRIDVAASVPNGALLVVEYTTDGHTWDSVDADGSLPSGVVGSFIQYRLRLTTGDAASAPTVDGVSIAWTTSVPTPGTTNNGNGSGTATPKHTGRTIIERSVKPGAKNSSANATAHRATTRTGSTKTSASGSGSQETTTVAPGGSSAAIAGGTTGGSGSGGSGDTAVQQSTTMSGWVMSEVKDDVGGTAGSSGTGGFGSGSSMGSSTAPGVALLFFAYTIGLAWSPASRLILRVALAAMAH